MGPNGARKVTEYMNRTAHTVFDLCLCIVIPSHLLSPCLPFKTITCLSGHWGIERKTGDHAETQRAVQEDRQQPREASGARAKREPRSLEQLSAMGWVSQVKSMPGINMDKI